MIHLNKAQEECVLHTEGALVIFAGPGSGKTRVICERYINLVLRHQVDVSNILTLTFTRKAAQEVAERIKAYSIKPEYVTTFHSICSKILRADGLYYGIPNNFTVYDKQDSQTVIKKVIKKLELSSADYQTKYIENCIQKAREAKLKNLTFSFPSSEIEKICDLYERNLVENNAIDFDGLLLKTFEILKADTHVRSKYSSLWEYIMIDEFQDTNEIQFEVIKLLSTGNICVVGDDDQSIYKFRGANNKIILNFTETYPDAKIYKLEQNYRSNQTIVNLSNKFIRTNIERAEKNLYSEKRTQTRRPIVISECQSEYQEAETIVRQIKQLLLNGYNFRDIAILYRTNNQAYIFEKFLIKEKLPYEIKSGLGFFERKVVKDILAYLRAITNPVDNNSLKRIINVPTRGLGEKTIQAIEEEAEASNISLLDMIIRCINQKTKPDKTIKNLQNFITTLSKIENGKTVYEIIENIIRETNYKEYIKEKDEEETFETNIELLRSLYRIAKEISYRPDQNQITQFLDHLSMYEGEQEIDSNKISLMTLHGAKGLEFPAVFITGLEEGLFPSLLKEDEEDIEEERRLCHVGISRSMEKLFLSYAKARKFHGQQRYQNPSRFLLEIKGIMAVEAI